MVGEIRRKFERARRSTGARPRQRAVGARLSRLVPKGRLARVTVAAGTLIVAALTAGRLAGASGVQSALMIAAALVAGAGIARRAWRALMTRHIGIDLLVTIAAAGALAIGEYWEAAAVTFLFQLGAYLEARTMRSTRRALGELLALAPVTALVLRGEGEVELPPHEVRPGEIVLVKPGAQVPVDGEVVEGAAAVDESMITGEPIPVEKVPGSPVYAGTIAQVGLLRVRTTGVGVDTTLARIIRRVEEAQEAKAPTQRFIERFARWYTPAIIGIAVVAFALTSDVALALTLLVIGCPGALVIAAPVSIIAGIGRAAKRGILIKGGQHLETAGKITALAFDKTGTLTTGRPRLSDVVALGEVPTGALMGARAVEAPVGPELVSAHAAGPARLEGVGAGGSPDAGPGAMPAEERWSPEEREVLYWAGIAEIGSEHPLAAPILAAATRLSPVPHPDAFEVRTGRGVVATHEGRRIGVGTAELLTELGVAVGDVASERLAALRAAGKTAVLVSLDDRVIGVLGIADSPRPNAAAAVARLPKLGIRRTVMLTGDHGRTAEAIAAAVGIPEVHAELLPEDKLARIRALQAEGHVVAMVGDGINDAPALAAADVGVAMGAAGTDVAIETADLALLADDLEKVPEAIRLARATVRNLHQNVVVALVTVAALLLGVLAGKVHMASGMLIHEASVLAVILNGMRLLRE